MIVRKGNKNKPFTWEKHDCSEHGYIYWVMLIRMKNGGHWAIELSCSILESRQHMAFSLRYAKHQLKRGMMLNQNMAVH